MTSATLIVGAIASVASCVLCMEVGGIRVKDSLVLPSHARKEVVYKKHQDVIKKIEAIIRSSRDFDTAERRVKNSVWPDKVLHISLAQRDRRIQPASTRAHSAPVATSTEGGFSKSYWTNLRSVIRDGAGYGSVLTDEGPRDLTIVEKTHPTSGTDAVAFLIYFEQPTT
jgi:hypothetical protein